MIYKGVSGSDGIAAAPVYLYCQEKIVIDHALLLPEQENEELDQLKEALEISIGQMNALRTKASGCLGDKELGILDAHILIASDPSLFADVAAAMLSKRCKAAAALASVIARYVEMFSAMADEYMQARAADISDVGERIMRNLLKMPPGGLNLIDCEVVVVARDILPSDTLSLDRRYVKGFVTDIGGRTSHAAILARTLEIPAVLGLKNITGAVTEGRMIIVDGAGGCVITEPTAEEITAYAAKKVQQDKTREQLRTLQLLPAETTDGHRVHLVANIGSPEDVAAVLVNGGEGVGLYRTEFLFMQGERLPTEDEQYLAYKTVVEKLAGKPVIIRTLDIGGDKEIRCFKMPHEMNPFLGWRAIRLCLDEREMFKTQLRAILRASAFGSVSMMYPMISGIAELRQANAVLAEARQELVVAGVGFDPAMKVGIMVEIPSAALTADILIKESDFFSIGTNDLCQYTLAVDRMNEKINDLYQPFHPAVLRLVKNVIDAAHSREKFAGMCGEMAGDPLATIVLLGLGLDEFSMSSSSIPVVKKIIRNVSYEQARTIMDALLAMENPDEIMEYSREFLTKLSCL